MASDSSEPRWGVRVLVEGLIAGIVAPLAVGILLVLTLPWIRDSFLARATCDDPRGLSLVQPITVTA